LEQSYKNIEILIYDDLSTDNSLKKLESFIDDRIHIYRGLVNKGVKFGRDFLLKKANGDFISFFDADDICHKNKYIKILNYFKNNPDIDIIGTRVKYINSKGIELYKRYLYLIKQPTKWDDYYLIACALAKLDAPIDDFKEWAALHPEYNKDDNIINSYEKFKSYNT
jgi:glycosyltransferase involved in cell wall biosynthesis